jgi:L-2,4-diaminobutyrate decarboxylase
MSTLNPILAGSAQSVEAYQQVIEQTSQAVVQWLKQPEMYQGKSVDELRERISLEFNEQGLGNQAAIDRAIEYFLKDSLSVHHPQCVAHLHCPSLVISQAAEVLINATNQSMDSWDQSPSATIIEMKLIEWLRARVGYPAGDAGVFTSGGTQSNLMGLMLARDAFFARQGTPSSRMGCRGYPQVQSIVLGKRPLLGAEEHGADGPRLPLGHAGENRRIRADGRVRSAGEDCASAG